MSKTTEPLIFISHSSADSAKTNLICTFLSESYQLNKDQIVNTSHKDYGIKAFQSLNKATIEKVRDSTIFIAYLSNNYFASTYCLVELGVAWCKSLEDDSYKVIPIIDKLLDFDQTKLLKLRKSIKIEGEDFLNCISDAFGKYGQTKSDYEELKSHHEILKNEYSKLFQKVDPLMVEAATNVKTFLLQTFDVSNKLLHKPAILYVDRLTYEYLSVELSKISNYRLLWAAYKSPLKVEGFVNDTFLTYYDKFFRDADIPKRQRLIIFEDPDEQKYYISGSLTEDEKKRRTAFNEANQDWLFYTTKESLLNAYNKHATSIGKYNVDDNIYFEFALIYSVSSFKMLFFSDFNNTGSATDKHDIDTLPLIFASLTGEVHSRFENKKMQNSVDIHRYVSENFKSLTNRKIITPA